ncbi:MAG TPA: outer membrane protein transport protein [Kofleriaceae bacterium]|jgi:long-chain fatty acid transport protein
MRKLILATSLLVPAAAYAGGYAIPDENARTLALSQSDLADQTGAEAILINPAGMAGQIGLDVSASLEWLDNRTDYSDPNLGTSSLLSHANTPPAGAVSFGDVLPNDMMWAAGIGFHVPYGGALNWPDGWQGQEYVRTVDQKIYQMTAGAAFQPLPYLSIGAAYVRYQITEELHQAVNFVDHYGDAGIGMSGGSSSFMLAAQGKLPWIPLQLAVSFKYKGSTQIDGNAHFTDVPPAFSTTLQDQSVTEQIAIPSELHAGAAYEVIPNLSVMFTFTNEFWSIYHSDTFIGSTGFTVVVPRDYNDAQVYRLGAEWAHVPFLSPLTLRVGALRSISQQPTATLSPSLTDGDSWAVSVGAGYEVIPDLRIDLGYQHAFFDTVTASGIETLPGTYKTQVDILSLGVNWRFDLLGRTSSNDPTQK